MKLLPYTDEETAAKDYEAGDRGCVDRPMAEQVAQAARALGAAREALAAAEQSMLTAVREAQTLDEVFED